VPGVVRRAAQPPPRHQQRPGHGRAGVGGQRPHDLRGGAGPRPQHPDQRLAGPAGDLGVAQHQRPEPLQAGVELAGQHVGEGERLGHRARQETVGVGGGPADPLAGEQVAEVAQGGRDRLMALGRRRRGVGGQAAQRPVLQQDQPVLQVRRLPVALAPGRAVGRGQAGRGQEPHPGPGQGGPPALEGRPRHLGLPGGRPPDPEPGDDPLGEAQRRVGVGLVEVGDQLAEARVVLAQPGDLALQRPGQPGQLLVGGEEPLADDARGRDGEVDGADQAVVQLGLLAGERVGRGGGEGDQVDLAELGNHRADDIAPQRGQVVALVEHHRGRPVAGQSRHPPPGRRLEQVPEVDPAVLAPGDLALQRRPDPGQLAGAALVGRVPPGRGLAFHLPDRDAEGPGPVGRPAPLGGVAEGGRRVIDLAERLVGEAGDGGAGVGGGEAGAGPEPRGRPEPLGLDGRVRAEHQRTVAEAADDLHAQQRLARPRRGDQVGGAPARLPVPLEGLQRQLLVASPAPRERQRLQARVSGHAR
jgi:hypothetical protein